MPARFGLRKICLFALSLFTLSPAAVSSPERQAYRTDRIIIQPKENHPQNGIRMMAALHRQSIRTLATSTGLQLVQLAPGTDVDKAVEMYRQSGLVEFAEPDYLFYASNVPNDPDYQGGLQWGLNNDGRAFGAAGADVDAMEAWKTAHSAPEIVVAVIDTGIRHTHEDLAQNMWRNTYEVPANGIDDDHNGVVDDVHGLNAITDGGNSGDDSGHGTHVAGIIGAAGNNGKGITGVAWAVQLMDCKFMDADGAGSTSDAVEAIDYARRNGAHVINASWGGADYSIALKRAIERARDAGIVFIAAAGNESADNDRVASYPANYNVNNVVAVASTNRRDQFDRNYSNYGRSTVDLAAPGTAIYSTWHTSDKAYIALSGTSMAAPFVAGALALMKPLFPDESPAELIQRLLRTADRLPSLEGKCVSGGRINLNKALSSRSPARLELLAPVSGGSMKLQLTANQGESITIEVSDDLEHWEPLSTNTVPADGKILVVDPAAQDLPHRFYRLRPGNTPANPVQ